MWRWVLGFRTAGTPSASLSQPPSSELFPQVGGCFEPVPSTQAQRDSGTGFADAPATCAHTLLSWAHVSGPFGVISTCVRVEHPGAPLSTCQDSGLGVHASPVRKSLLCALRKLSRVALARQGTMFAHTEKRVFDPKHESELVCMVIRAGHQGSQKYSPKIGRIWLIRLISVHSVTVSGRPGCAGGCGTSSAGTR
jgi:hypothetical protein